MERRKKLPNGYWNNQDHCLEEARKYKTKAEWQGKSPLSYRWAAKNGWLDECSSHMASIRKPDGYWTLDRCKQVASKYQIKVEWRVGDKASFSAANRRGWVSECCSHMQTGGLWFGPASIVETLLSHNIAYEMEHRLKGSTAISRRPYDFYLPKYNLLIEFHGEQHKIGWGRRTGDAQSIQERDAFKKEWALSNGYHFLEIGQWDVTSKEDIGKLVLEKLVQISSKDDLILNLKRRPLTPGEQELAKSRIRWTLAACKEEASKYSAIKKWQVGSASSYNAAFAKGWLDECSAHMERKLHPRRYWTLERCIEQAKQFESKAKWSAAKRSGYTIASKNGWMDQCTSHMQPDLRTVPKQRLWTLEKCLELAKTCATRTEFKSKSVSAYQRARIRGWLDQCCAHMN